MKKEDIAYEISVKCDVNPKKSKEIVNVVFDRIKKSLARGEGLEVRGFGTFSVVERKEKIGQDITHGKPVFIPRHKAVKFKASKALKALV